MAKRLQLGDISADEYLQIIFYALPTYPLNRVGFRANNSYIHVLDYPDPRSRPGAAPGPRVCPLDRY